MVKNPLDMRYIHKRNRFLERKKNITESANKLPSGLLESNISKDYYNIRVLNFLKECSSFKDSVSILESLYSNNDFELLEEATNIVIDSVIPMVESSELPNCISYIEASDIGSINKDKLIETAKVYKTVDRIRKNHRNISKRFDLSDMNNKSDRKICFKVCEMVDTYDLSKFIKFNIALEEIAYIGFTNGNRISDDVMVEHVSDYFLMISDNSAYDIDSFKKAIESSKVISEGADCRVEYLMNKGKILEGFNNLYWRDRINKWKLDPNKGINGLVEIARDNFYNINTLNSIVSMINEFCKINDIEFDIMKIFEDADSSVDGKEAYNIISFIKENNIENNADTLIENLNMIWESDLNDLVYDDGTEEPQSFTSDEFDSFKMNNLVSDSNTVKEFLNQLEKTSMKEESTKSIKRILSPREEINESNLINYVDSNGYLSKTIRSYSFKGTTDSISNLLESSVKCLNNILYGTDSKAYYNLYENRFDICIRSKYKIILSEAQELAREFSEYDKRTILSIKEYTTLLEEIYNSRFFDIVDKLSNDKTIAANITPREAGLLCDILSPFNESIDNSTEGFFDEFINLCRTEANPRYDQIKRECSYINNESFDYSNDNISRINFCADILGIEEGAIDNIKNAAKEIGTTSKNVATNLARGAKNLAKDPNSLTQDNSVVKANSSNKIKETLPAVDKNNKAPAGGYEDFDDKKAINSINDMKLAWQGVKAKAKGLHAKEQEMSRDMDVEFNHLLKTIKTGLTPDHREEIITGEVNHSLSKAIKIAIALAAPAGGAAAIAGAGAKSFAYAAIAPIIGAIAIFARSKFTTTKEKKLILDEIDIELQVLEREINRAEQSGSTKKYRELLTIQKNLMRKRQEIYYNMAKKGKRIPMQATAGLRRRE